MTKAKLVVVPALKQPIQPAPGFAKKLLARYKLDALALCQFGCRYCSSNEGNYLRIRRAPFRKLTEEQLGISADPKSDPALMFFAPDTLASLAAQLDRHNPSWGAGETLVYSMLTDGFSPWLVANGHTRALLDCVLERTSFRIRVLTKSAIVGTAPWVKYFGDHPGRFVIGLSTGTMCDRWARDVEIGTSSPSARIKALHTLQDAGIPTYGMLCPIFPDLLEADGLEKLIDAIRPGLVEHVWAEPFNDRANWRQVRDGYPPGSAGWRWMTETFEGKGTARWSGYAVDLYARLRAKAVREGWLEKLRYLLYEANLVRADIGRLDDFAGILFQSSKNKAGLSMNPHVAARQRVQWSSV